MRNRSSLGRQSQTSECSSDMKQLLTKFISRMEVSQKPEALTIFPVDERNLVTRRLLTETTAKLLNIKVDIYS